MMLIDRVGDFTHPISAFYDNAISHKFINDFIVNIEGQTPLIRKNPDEDQTSNRCSLRILVSK